MPQADAFALPTSGLNAFLFAEVGTELNGSTLTILSLLARLGKDPWAEAARWAKLPKAALIDILAKSIAEMPLPPQAILEAHDTAARLVLLLPAQAQARAPAKRRALTKGLPRLPLPIPKLAPLTMVACALAIGLALSFVFSQRPANTELPPFQQIVAPHSK